MVLGVSRGNSIDGWGEGGGWWGESRDKWHEGQVWVGQARVGNHVMQEQRRPNAWLLLYIGTLNNIIYS